MSSVLNLTQFLSAMWMSEPGLTFINIGHSIGLDHWERPTVAHPETDMGRVRARPGMVLCVEPQIAGVGGDATWSRGLFLIEDQILIIRDGIEVLTRAFPRDLYVSGG